MAGMLVALGGFGFITGGAEKREKNCENCRETLDFAAFKLTLHFDQIVDRHVFAGDGINAILLDVFFDKSPLKDAARVR